jgi:hypothetical protein
MASESAQMAATRTHPAVRVTVGNREADIDVGLAGLIEASWRLGINTEYSCQGRLRPGTTKAEPWGYILFADVEDLRAFLACFDDTELSERRFATRHETDPVTGIRQPVHRRGWSSTLSVNALDDGDSAECGQFRLRGRLGFPAVDIARMETVLHDRVRAAAVVDQTGAS